MADQVIVVPPGFIYLTGKEPVIDTDTTEEVVDWSPTDFQHGQEVSVHVRNLNADRKQVNLNDIEQLVVRREEHNIDFIADMGSNTGQLGDFDVHVFTPHSSKLVSDPTFADVDALLGLDISADWPTDGVNDTPNEADGAETWVLRTPNTNEAGYSTAIADPFGGTGGVGRFYHDSMIYATNIASPTWVNWFRNIYSYEVCAELWFYPLDNTTAGSFHDYKGLFGRCEVVGQGVQWCLVINDNNGDRFGLSVREAGEGARCDQQSQYLHSDSFIKNAWNHCFLACPAVANKTTTYLGLNGKVEVFTDPVWPTGTASGSYYATIGGFGATANGGFNGYIFDARLSRDMIYVKKLGRDHYYPMPTSKHPRS